MYCLFRVLFPRQNILLMFMFMLLHRQATIWRILPSFVKCNAAAAARTHHDLRSLPDMCLGSTSNCYFHSHFDGSSQFDLSQLT